MTYLTESLVTIGGIFIFGVILYNQWQEYQAKKRVDRAFSSEHNDVLMTPEKNGPNAGGERHEPSFSADKKAASNPDHPISQQTPQQTSQPVSQQAKNVEEAPVLPKELPVDEGIDCVIPMTLEEAVRGDKIITIFQGLRHVGNKAVHSIGQNLDGNWEVVTREGMYTALRVGVQLASRSKVLNELEFSELVTRLRQVGDELSAEPDVPDMAAVITEARRLHQFIVDHDVRLSVNVHSNGAPWEIDALSMLLEKQGFALRADRTDDNFWMPDGHAGFLFSLSTNIVPSDAFNASNASNTATLRLTLLLDVPRVASQKDGFGAMIACAQFLARQLDGTIVDDGNQVLPDAALEEIAQQVLAFYDDMQKWDIPAGSSRALRLFS